MSDTTTSDTTAEVMGSAEGATASNGPASSGQSEGGFDFSERSKVNETLDKVDWAQMGKIGRASGIILAVIVAQILIKGVLDTINLLPIIPGLLELLGLVIVGKWSWDNLTTGEKRNAVIEKVQGLRKEYLG